jgi:predicted transcriptional regulator
MAHLNIYLSKEREKWLRHGLQEIARTEHRSLSYIVEEALVKFMQLAGKKTPTTKRKDHRSSATR